MTSLRAFGLSLIFALAALAALACGPTFVPSDAGDSDGSGGRTSSGGGGASSGGTEPGPASGGSEASCGVDDDCILAADLDDECFSVDCSHPIAVTKVVEAAELCLVPWHERSDASTPEECASYDRGQECPAICALPLDCPEAACDDGVCLVRSDLLVACEE